MEVCYAVELQISCRFEQADATQCKVCINTRVTQNELISPGDKLLYCMCVCISQGFLRRSLQAHSSAK